MPAITEAVDNSESARNLDAEAVDHLLRRIATDPDIRYHFGALTETFDKLCAAYAARSGRTVRDVEDEVLGNKLPRSRCDRGRR